jgi:hypothetical protein
MLLNPEMGIMVSPVRATRDAQAAAQQAVGTQAPVQFTCKINMDEWDIMKQIVPAEACLMPHRQPHSHQGPEAAAAAGAAAVGEGGQAGGSSRAGKRRRC